MKVIARFPVKSNPFLLWLVVVIHLVVLLVAFQLLSFGLLFAVAIVMLVASLYLSLRQYNEITRAGDDLCWSGENWLMHLDKGSSAEYLELQTSSWVTAEFCLLRFDIAGQNKAWFFGRKMLGDRLYRELCYLVRISLKRASEPSSAT